MSKNNNNGFIKTEKTKWKWFVPEFWVELDAVKSLHIWDDTTRTHLLLQCAISEGYIPENTWLGLWTSRFTMRVLMHALHHQYLPLSLQSCLVVFVLTFTLATNSGPSNLLRWFNCVIYCFNWNSNKRWVTTKTCTPCGSLGAIPRWRPLPFFAQ